MSSTTWSSNPIQLTEAVSADVHASADGVTLGEAANHTLASDLLLSPEQALELGVALILGSHECHKAREAKS
jgi:hypothetical protein